MAREKPLKHPEDLRSIAFVLIAIFLTVAGFYVPLGRGFTELWFLAQFIFSYCCSVINHNHTHAPIFSDKRLNAIFGYLLTISKGHTSTQVIVPHNLNHHVYPGKPEDWSRPELAWGKQGIFRIPTYLYRASREMAYQRKLPGAPTLSQSGIKQGKQERLCLLIFSLLCIAIDWRHFLFFVLPIWILVMLTLLTANLLQHDGCNPDTEWEHSRNFTGWLGNWFMFNNGFHTIHHLKPTLHWSLLPEDHRTLVEPHLSQTFEEKSIMRFLLIKYLFRQVQSQNQAHASSPLKSSVVSQPPRP